jgi:hypothetical protein
MTTANPYPDDPSGATAPQPERRSEQLLDGAALEADLAPDLEEVTREGDARLRQAEELLDGPAPTAPAPEREAPYTTSEARS